MDTKNMMNFSARVVSSRENVQFSGHKQNSVAYFLRDKKMTQFKDRSSVTAKGCFNRLLNPTEVCVNLGEVFHREKKKRMFYCTRNFPQDCKEYGCPKMMPINEEWLKDLRKINQYE